MSAWETLRSDLAVLEQRFAGTDGAGMHVVLLALPAGESLEERIRRLPHDQLSDALERAERATAVLTRIAHHDPAAEPALARLYHLIALLERHAWQDVHPPAAAGSARTG